MRPTKKLEVLFGNLENQKKFEVLRMDMFLSEMKIFGEVVFLSEEVIKIEFVDPESGDIETQKHDKNSIIISDIKFAVKYFVDQLTEQIFDIKTKAEKIDFLDTVEIQFRMLMDNAIKILINYEIYLLEAIENGLASINNYRNGLNKHSNVFHTPKVTLNWTGQQNQLAQLIKLLIDKPSENKGKSFFSNNNDEVWDFFASHITLGGKKIDLSALKRLSSEDKVPKEESPKEIKLKGLNPEV